MATAAECFVDNASADALPIRPLTAEDFERWREQASERERSWIERHGFEAKRDTLCVVPGEGDNAEQALIGVDAPPGRFCLGQLPDALPSGTWRLEADWPAAIRHGALVGFALGAYRFDRYKEAKPARAQLRLEAGDDAQAVLDEVEAIYLVRDLINTPAADLLPDALADAANALADAFDARFRCVIGETLLTEGYPAIHAVGRASNTAPRLIDLRWGDANAPRVTLVGKGVCFDSGGLDIKPSSGMRLMKKDMGGAAHALGLARLIMSRRLPVQLRVLIPAVENAISGDAMRPGDVLATRKGSSIEIDNTDAEGRVILSDALWEASSEQPSVLIDFATLTGAARVAVGTEIAAMFSNDDALASEIAAAGDTIDDPVCRLPLHAPYRKLIESKVADIANSGSTPFGGAIIAALFLEHFVGDAIPWAHVDIMAWNASARPGRPEGGEAMGIGAVFRCLQARFGG